MKNLSAIYTQIIFLTLFQQLKNSGNKSSLLVNIEQLIVIIEIQ
jgi:hypothetical protein